MIARRRLLVFGLLTTLLVLGVLVWPLWPIPGINRQNYKRIRDGMTQSQVERILGDLPGDHRTFPFEVGMRAAEHSQKIDEGCCVEWWQGDDGIIAVRFDETGKVVGALFAMPVCRPDPESPLDMLRRLLRP